MASSSSSSFSSADQSWKHDVFLSFRGTDTRKTFVDHLYSALDQHGIQTYKDDQTLARGEAIGPALLKAIEESQIAVIVFSENYADSSWCLQELEHIMKCKDERGQVVMPIFYHMDPSEVRKQKGKYGEALDKHDLENKNVASWREALTNVGNLSGWETKVVANGHEAQCVKEIVATISNRLCVVSSDNEDLIGIESRLQDLRSKLKMESDDVVMVGVWGLGGGGKTTLASSVYNEISSRFDGCCFVENIREKSSKLGLPKLQEEIISVGLRPTQVGVIKRVEDGRRLIKIRLRRKKVLIVLDDVDHLDQLKALAGSHDWFGDGSRIIITTRDNHLLNAHKVNVIYNISLLNDGEAYKLFCKHALGHGIEDYEMLSKDVVSYAGGLPLALKVLGSFLCDKDKSEWRSALARLKDVPDTDIMEKLKISYDGLKPMEKELFLDIACFFRGKDKDDAMVILDACGFHPVIGVKVLIQKALITVSPGVTSAIKVFEMHDLLQEMGHYIVRGENPKNPEKHSRVWQRGDVLNICNMDATMRNDRIEALQIGMHHDKLPHILHEVVGNMTKLRWISVDRYPPPSLSREFQPMELCYLQLQWSDYLPNLKAIEIHRSFDLVRTPDFDGLPCLERMILSECANLKEIHPSIGYHERLIFLYLKECTSLEMFPPIIRMKNLETLKLCDCTQLQKFPEIQMNMDKLVELQLRQSGIESLPSSIGKYCTSLVSLNLKECRSLRSIESNFRLLKHLKELHLEGCNQLNNMPAEGLFDVECCLQLLCFSDMPFKVLGFPSSLRRLDLRKSNLVDGDISSVFCTELSNLQALDLSENKFSRLHSSLLQLPRLKYLNLSYCTELVELPDLPSSIAILVANGCDSLKIVGDFPTNLKWLWKVSLSLSNMFDDNFERVVQYMLQAKCIKEIVGEISKRLSATISSEDDLVGIGDRLLDLKSKMEMEPDGVVMVGIWGLGGGGKTTLASSLYSDISSKFDGCCFIENIREESSKFGLPKLQNDILKIVLKQTKMEVNRVADGRGLIKSRFRHKKVLIVLDDVDRLDQLKELAGSHDWFGEGSRIIITTRDKHLLNAHNVNVIYNISLLNDNEAMKLFCKHAPQRRSEPIEDYEMLSKEVVSYAGGLPLALIVLGSFLCDKDKSEWMSALARLKDIPDTDIVEKLKISYDGLKPVEKELFLDIACYFRRKEKDEAMGIFDACGFHPIIGVKVLIQKALITVSKAGKFDMHDLLQEMGHYIVRGESPRNVEKHSRVWQIEDVVKICAMDAATENDRIELEALHIKQQWDKVPYNLPQVVENMKRLRWICCIRYPTTSFTGKFQPTNLCYMELRYSLLEKLWDGNKFLPNLKVIDLAYSRKLVSTPDLRVVPCLERMILRRCDKLREIHPSIGYHENLVFVDMENCRSLDFFPPIVEMRKLETLILSSCNRLHKFPEIQKRMDNLIELRLRKSGIEIVPSSIGRFCTNLLSLDLRNCDHLQSIEGNFHRLKHLEGLYLNGCDQLKIPVEGLFDVECCLQGLSVSWTSFKGLHQGAASMKLFGFTHSLRRLNLSSSKLVDGDISSVFCKELSNLQVLDLSGNDFSRLHSSLSQLPRLKLLDLSNCLNLVELPDLPSSIAVLIAFGCNSLEFVGNFPTNLKWLWKVSLPAGTMLSCNDVREFQSMFQGNAIEDYFISIQFSGAYIPVRGCKLGTFTLQLPWNWYNEFSGFLISVNWHMSKGDAIVIKDVIGMENEDDDLEVSDGTPQIDEYMVGICSQEMGGMSYISFSSLRHTSWWNSTHSTVLFSIKGPHLADVYSKVELVPKKSHGDDSIEGAKDNSEFWDEEAQNKKTFKIEHDSKSCIEIRWCHNIDSDLFDNI
ncbi:hypothetical protein OSB04_018703 [Centaurea solstitialis]|uniref:TIR domain-containing protein n=1 Tax=Centaurea solstitialis TaxID=347529 RepID=A0AA38TCW4_9ASTR|nr:hypothetical protein OSB04_018703 [Centaurea solstitialis]